MKYQVLVYALCNKTIINFLSTVVMIRALTLCMLGNFSWFFVIFFTVSVSNSLGPDQAQQFVGPDLDPNWLQKSTVEADSRQRVKG